MVKVLVEDEGLDKGLGQLVDINIENLRVDAPVNMDPNNAVFAIDPATPIVVSLNVYSLT